MSTHETIQHQQPDQETSSQQRSSSDTADSDNRTTHDNNDQEKGTSLDKEDYNDPPPDGGYGWFIVLAAFLSLFAVFGTNISWGKSCMMP